MYKRIKYMLDWVVSLTLVLILCPIWLLTLGFLAISVNGWPIFIQERPGENARPFKMIKFKTMADLKDTNGNLLPDKVRITRIGRFVRLLSIDELPQLFNVLSGDMSIVGPRPLLFKYVPLYTDEQKRRQEVRPGITGWAQVNGRNKISWQEKFKLDVFYVDNISFTLDLKILLMTVQKVFLSEGINQSDERPMEPFNGSN